MAGPLEQAGVVAYLSGLAGGAPVETHISCVFRGVDTVWKLKKAVRLGFLDFSEVADRRRFLLRELALNGDAAPGLYRDVVAVTRAGEGFALGGVGEVVDWVLRMARVPEGDFLDERVVGGSVDAGLLDGMADAVVALHGGQVPAPTGVSEAGRLLRVLEGNAAAAVAAGLDGDAVAGWRLDALALLGRLGAAIEARAPLVRRCHGDLHLGNMLVWRGVVAAFDALEFDEGLATIDPGYDLAFLLMDLDVRLSRGAANAVLNRYVARTGDAGLLGVLPLFLSLRAVVRAHVAASQGQDGGGLLRAARGYLLPSRAVVVAVGGLQGTGKSTLARALAPGLGVAPGAVILRSDEVRKRLAGVGLEERLAGAAYTDEARRRTEAAMLEAMRIAVDGGHSVVLDATFLDPAARAAFRAAAGAPFLGVWLEGDMAVLEARVTARRGDASDATVAVLRAAAAGVRAPSDWLVLDAAAGGHEQTVQAAAAML